MSLGDGELLLLIQFWELWRIFRIVVKKFLEAVVTVGRFNEIIESWSKEFFFLICVWTAILECEVVILQSVMMENKNSALNIREIDLKFPQCLINSLAYPTPEDLILLRSLKQPHFLWDKNPWLLTSRGNVCTYPTWEDRNCQKQHAG
jgi:hypothetical protein